MVTRRRWLDLAGRAGFAALLPGCAATEPAAINRPAMESLGGWGYGVWQSGRLIAGMDTGRRMPSLSITKTFAALAVVRAVGEGWLEPDQPLAEMIPEWKADAGKNRVTTRMLVNLTSGFPSGAGTLYRPSVADKGRAAIALPLADAPGERFRYGPAPAEILAEVLRRGLARRGSSLEDFLGSLMRRARVSSPLWRRDKAGIPYLSTGAEFGVNDLGRLGMLVAKLARGGNTAGLKAAVFHELAAPRPANPMFSAGIWWNRNAAHPGAAAIEPECHLDDVRPPSFWRNACLDPAIDPGWLAMVGSGGKRVYVLPSRDIVIARVGRSLRWNDGAFLRTVTA